MIKVVTRLKIQHYRHGEKIVAKGDRMKDLIIVSKGTINLNGYFHDMRGNEFCTRIINLPRKSWYGDYQILLDMNSTFDVTADKVHNEKKNPHAKKE